MAKTTSTILLFSLLALGLLLFGCSQPAAPPGGGAGEAAPAAGGAIAPQAGGARVNLNACDLLTAEEVASTCGVTEPLTAENRTEAGRRLYYCNIGRQTTSQGYLWAVELTYYTATTDQRLSSYTDVYANAREQLKSYFERRRIPYLVEDITNSSEISNLGDYAILYNLERHSGRTLSVAKGDKILEMGGNSRSYCNDDEKLKALAQTALTRMR